MLKLFILFLLIKFANYITNPSVLKVIVIYGHLLQVTVIRTVQIHVQLVKKVVM